MSPNSAPLRRRLGHGGLSLLVVATSSALLWTASSETASAAPAPPEPECSGGTCVVSFAATGDLQTYTVPAGVTSLIANVTGARGGSSGDVALAGGGGRSTGTLTVSAGDELSLLVGTAGSRSTSPTKGGAGGYGGGGAGGDNDLPSSGGAGGGGGSFVFGGDAALLLAAGGGGGAVAGYAGGAGGGPGAAAGAGADSDPAALGGQPGTLESNGAGGLPNGGTGTGAPVTATSLPVGGRGGASTSPFPTSGHVPGAGGGGGYHAGGGGAGPVSPFPENDTYGAGGGGGAGFAAEGVTDAAGEAGVQKGDGTITLSYSDAQQIAFTSGPDKAVVGKTPYYVFAEGTGINPITFSIDPSTTNGACTIAGRSTITFAHVGTCAIAADQLADKFHGPGHRVQTFPVGQGSQTITFTPLPANGTVGDELPLVATGGGSGSPVEFALASGSTRGACEVVGTSLSLTGDGTCAVVATQGGNIDYTDAQPTSQQVGVTLVETTTELTFDENTPVYGQPVTASVRVRGTSEGTVQLFIDGDPVGEPITLNQVGRALVPLPDLSAGGHQVTASFTPAKPAMYAGSSSELTLPVAQARSKAKVRVRGDRASVVVTTVVPGAGTAEGTVVFIVDGNVFDPLPLFHGRATLDATVPEGVEVAVVYDGDENFTSSSDSTLRTDPTITAKITSAAPRSSMGWYRAPVVVRFTCTEGSAPLTDDCPDPITLTEEGPSQTVIRTVTAEDGGIATATLTGLNLDSTKPLVSAYGVEEGQRFFAAAPDAGCVASDALSGVQRCAAVRKTKDDDVTYLVAAIDQAGNVNTLEVHATTFDRGITNAAFVDGTYQVRAGQAYTLVDKSNTRARVLAPTLAPKKPSKKGDKFQRMDSGTWTLGYTIPKTLKPGKTYNLGIRDSSKHVIKIQVIS